MSIPIVIGEPSSIASNVMVVILLLFMSCMDNFKATMTGASPSTIGHQLRLYFSIASSSNKFLPILSHILATNLILSVEVGFLRQLSGSDHFPNTLFKTVPPV